jgi:hypothetical protein
MGTTASSNHLSKWNTDRLQHDEGTFLGHLKRPNAKHHKATKLQGYWQHEPDLGTLGDYFNRPRMGTLNTLKLDHSSVVYPPSHTFEI